jgi:hypothetical protein
MSLRDQIMFKDPERVFLNTNEFAEVREFRIADGRGSFIVFNAKVVWDNEMAKQLAIVKIHGVYQGDLVAYITHATLPRPPLAGELVYSPANQPWEIIDVTDEMGMWKLALSMTRSQPAHYGSN